MISIKDVDKAREQRDADAKANNKACYLIRDAKARYIKEKTRAKSKKAALEKDAALASPRFNCLAEYERRSDIIEAYGCDYITASECDRLEALWDEREEIMNHVEDGEYVDAVTKLLYKAEIYLIGILDEQIDAFDKIKFAYEQQFKED